MDNNIDTTKFLKEKSNEFFRILGENKETAVTTKSDNKSEDEKKLKDYDACHRIMDNILDDNNSRSPLSHRLRELETIISEMP